MRLSKFSKKLIAYLCAIALVVVSLAYAPATSVSAQEDPYGTQVWKNSTDGSAYKLCLVDQNTKAEFNGTFQVEGTNLFIAATASIIKPNYAKVTLNGTELDPWQGAYFRIPIANLTDNADNTIVVDDAVGGEYTIILRAGDPGYDPVETTQGETTTAEPKDPYGDQTWHDATDGSAYKICVVGQDTESEFGGTFQVEGTSLFIAATANIIKPNYVKVTLNGTELDPWQGAYFRIPIESINDNADNTIVVDDAVGQTYTLILRAGTPTWDDPTEAPTDVTEAPTDVTEAPTDVTEAPTDVTEAPTDVTEAPTDVTEAPTDVTEAPTDVTEAPASEWVSTLNKWALRKDDGSFEIVAAGGEAYDGFNGIASFYSGSWGGGDVDVKAPTPDDPNKLDIKVNSAGTGDWSMQVHINKTGLDDTKVYTAKLTAGETVLSEEIISEVSVYDKTVNLANKLGTGETTLELTIEEKVKPDPPVPQEITITPNEEQIAANYNIWAKWTNPDQTAKAYVYLEQADDAHAAATANNGWIFNDEAVQPMGAVDKVAQTRDGLVKVAPGGTYTLIVEAYDAWGRSTGSGSVEITIPDAPVVTDITFTRAERVDTEIGGTTYYATFANWEAITGAAGYKSFYDVEDDDHKVKATTNGWVWSDQNDGIGSSDTWVDNSAQTKNDTFLDENTTYTLIVVAFNASNEEIARGSVELPAKSGPTESPTVEPTTESGGIVMNIDIESPEEHNNTTVGGYTIYSGGWAHVTAVAGVDEENDDHIKMAQKNNDSWDTWGLQVSKAISGLTPNETYTVEWVIKSDNNDGTVKPDFDGLETNTPLTGTEQTLTGEVKANDDGVATMVIGVGNVGFDNAIEYQQPILKDSEGNIVYPPQVEPTTEAPTEEPTTEAPTAEPTTEAPTQAPTAKPTTKPTTKAPVKPPSKVKIKKIYKKKKSAKKIKLKIKAVKGAKGYQVQVSKKKKSKVLYRKFVKKTKIKIKSKKFKNKKKLYIKVRAYKLDGIKKVYGAWSKVKKVKIKKR